MREEVTKKDKSEEYKTMLLDYSEEEITEILKNYGQPSFRAGQVFEWIHKGVGSFDEMRNIPKSLKEMLSIKYSVGYLNIISKMESADGTIKYLLGLQDGNIIESVRMVYHHGNSVCISTQVGCKMGCDFCASAKAGFIRNLTPGEMLNQVLTIIKDTEDKVSNVVLMGIGEPFDNYENVMKFIYLLNHKKGLNIGFRKITISTCGLLPEIEKFIDENIQVNLSISLHSAQNSIRSNIMPINKTYTIDKLIKTCKIYTRRTGRRITFEYSLMENINDSEEQAEQLSTLLKGMLCHVNLIPVNVIEEGIYIKSSKQKLNTFKEILEKNKIPVSVRRVLGNDIMAACGQLRRGQTGGCK